MPNQINFKRPLAQASMIVGLGLLLSACGGGIELPGIDPEPTEQAGLIKGQITPFKAGDVSTVKPPEPDISAPVTTEGKFDLNLPTVEAMKTTYKSTTLVEPKDIFGCDASQIVSSSSTPGMKLLTIQKLITDKQQNIIAEIDPTSKAYNYKAWWLSTVDGTFKFKGTCDFIGEIDTTLELKKGWNVVDTYTYFATATEKARSSYMVSAQPTTYIPWKTATGAATRLSLSAQSIVLSENFFTPWKNLPRYQNR